MKWIPDTFLILYRKLFTRLFSHFADVYSCYWRIPHLCDRDAFYYLLHSDWRSVNLSRSIVYESSCLLKLSKKKKKKHSWYFGRLHWISRSCSSIFFLVHIFSYVTFFFSIITATHFWYNRDEDTKTKGFNFSRTIDKKKRDELAGNEPLDEPLSQGTDSPRGTGARAEFQGGGSLLGDAISQMLLTIGLPALVVALVR